MEGAFNASSYFKWFAKSGVLLSLSHCILIGRSTPPCILRFSNSFPLFLLLQTQGKLFILLQVYIFDVIIH